MSNLKLFINIIKRENSEAYINFYKNHNTAVFFSSLCKGTASKSMLDYLGLEDTEKTMFQMVVTSACASKMEHDLIYKMGIDIPGNGIALTIPMGSIGGSLALGYLIGEQQHIIGEVTKMSETPYALIVVIAEKGNIDTVMDAARSVGAKGGTVINAKGTGSEFTSKFFGVSIAAEKEIIYIVAKHKDKDKIIRAIMEKAGMQTDAKAVVFSLPVENVAGLHSVTEDEENN